MVNLILDELIYLYFIFVFVTVSKPVEDKSVKNKNIFPELLLERLFFLVCLMSYVYNIPYITEHVNECTPEKIFFYIREIF